MDIVYLILFAATHDYASFLNSTQHEIKIFALQYRVPDIFCKTWFVLEVHIRFILSRKIPMTFPHHIYIYFFFF